MSDTATADAPVSTVSFTLPPAIVPIQKVKIQLPQLYKLRGQCIHRIMFHQGTEGATDNYFNGSNYDAKRVYPVVNATLTLTQKGQDKPLATVNTCANGWFELDTELWTDRSYILNATLLNDDEGLLEESLETEITITKKPKPGVTEKIPLNFQRQVKNYPLPAASKSSAPGPLLDLKEKREIPLVAPKANTDSNDDNEIEDAIVTLKFLDNAALVFNSFALKVPYVNQRAYSLNITDTVTINKTKVKKILFVTSTTIESVTESLALGNVSGSIMCFPTSTGMLAAYYGLGADISPPAMAKQAYEVWRKERFIRRNTEPDENEKDVKDKQYLYLYRKDSNSIWTIWEQMGKVMTERAKGDSRFKQEKPWPEATGQWKMHVDNRDNLLQASNHNHLRAEISRGWPVVVGTNATKGHVMLIKGLLLNDDGSVNRVICNDPYGNLEIAPTAVPGAVPAGSTASQKKSYSDERKTYLSKERSYQNNETNSLQPASTLGKGAYYNVSTQGYQDFERLPNQLDTLAGLGKRLPFTMTNHFALRFYFDCELIRREKMVLGSQAKGSIPL